jgi:putative FmdB family regulatory protein
MPFYEYQCNQCGHLFEAMQKITEAPLKKCPACGKNALKKLLSAPVFRLKGSGWYETDFKSDQERKRNLAGADAEAKTEAGPAAKTEATPAAPGGTDSTAKPAAASSAANGNASASAGSGGAKVPAAGKRRAGSAPRPAKRAPVAAKRRSSGGRRAAGKRGRR